MDLRAFLAWRTSKRKTVSGWLAVFAGQAVFGGGLCMLVLRAATGDFGAVQVFCAIAFAIASGLSGPVFATVWALLLLNVANVALGLAFGVWPASPAWWRAAAEDWGSGAVIPATIWLTMAGLPLIYAATSFGLHRVWMIMLNKLLAKLAVRGSQPRGKDAQDDPAKFGLVSEAEASAYLAHDGAGEDGLTVTPRSPIRRIENGVNGETEPSADDQSAPEGNSIYGNLGIDGTDVDLLGKGEPKEAGKVLGSAPASLLKKAGIVKPSVSDEDRLRLQMLAEELEREKQDSSDPEAAIERFIKRFRSNLEKLNDQQIGWLKTLAVGDAQGVIDAALGLQTGMPSLDTTFQSSVDKAVGVDGLDPLTIKRTGETDVESGADDLATTPTTEGETSAGDEAPAETKIDPAKIQMTGRRLGSLLALAEIEGAPFQEEPSGAQEEPSEKGPPSQSSSAIPLNPQEQTMATEPSNAFEALLEKAKTPLTPTAEPGPSEAPETVSGDEGSPEASSASVAVLPGSDPDPEAEAEAETVAEDSAASDPANGPKSDNAEDASFGGFSLPHKTTQSGDGAGQQKDDAPVSQEAIATVQMVRDLHFIFAQLSTDDGRRSLLAKFEAEHSIQTSRLVNLPIVAEQLGDQRAHELRQSFHQLMRASDGVSAADVLRSGTQIEARLKDFHSRPHTVHQPQLRAIEKEIANLREMASRLISLPGHSSFELEWGPLEVNLGTRLASLYKMVGAPASLEPSKGEVKDALVKASTLLGNARRGEMPVAATPQLAPPASAPTAPVEPPLSVIQVQDIGAVPLEFAGVVASRVTNPEWFLDPVLGDIESNPLHECKAAPGTPEFMSELPRLEFLAKIRQQACAARDALSEARRAQMEAQARSEAAAAELEQRNVAAARQTAVLSEREAEIERRERAIEAKSRDLQEKEAEFASIREELIAEAKQNMEAKAAIERERNEAHSLRAIDRIGAFSSLPALMPNFLDRAPIPPRFKFLERDYLAMEFSVAIERAVTSRAFAAFPLAEGADGAEDPGSILKTFVMASCLGESSKIINELATNLEIPLPGPGLDKRALEAAQDDDERAFIMRLFRLKAERSDAMEWADKWKAEQSNRRMLAERGSRADAADMIALQDRLKEVESELGEQKERADLLEAEAERLRASGMQKENDSTADGPVAERIKDSDDLETATKIRQLFAEHGMPMGLDARHIETDSHIIFVGVTQRSFASIASRVEKGDGNVRKVVVLTNLDVTGNNVEILPLTANAAQKFIASMKETAHA